MQTIQQQLQEMAQEEQELRFTSFTNDTALEVGLMLIEEARQGGKGITVDITVKGQRLFGHAMKGTTVGNEDWIQRKNNVTNHFGSSSWHVAQRLRSEDKTLEEHYGLPVSDYAQAGGAFPLFVIGEGQVGTITVSGLPDQEDHDLLISVLRRFLMKSQ